MKAFRGGKQVEIEVKHWRVSQRVYKLALVPGVVGRKSKRSSSALLSRHCRRKPPETPRSKSRFDFSQRPALQQALANGQSPPPQSQSPTHRLRINPPPVRASRSHTANSARPFPASASPPLLHPRRVPPIPFFPPSSYLVLA